MKKARRDLIDDVCSRVTNARFGFKSWYTSLPDDARKELDAVKASFDHKRHQKKAYARAIVEAAKDRGWQVGTVGAVVAWLSQKN